MRILALASIILLGACEVTDGANGAQIAYGTSVWNQFNCQDRELYTFIYTDDHCEAGQSCIWEIEIAERAYRCAGDVEGKMLGHEAIEKIEACGFTVDKIEDYQQHLDPMGHELSADFDSDVLILEGEISLYDVEAERKLAFNSEAGFVFRAQDGVKLSDCDM